LRYTLLTHNYSFAHTLNLENVPYRESYVLRVVGEMNHLPPDTSNSNRLDGKVVTNFIDQRAIFEKLRVAQLI
jgi:hypothetical protein